MTSMPIRLARAEENYRWAAERAEIFRVDRNRMVLDAIASGMKPADIARAIGVTRARITQIANQND